MRSLWESAMGNRRLAGLLTSKEGGFANPDGEEPLHLYSARFTNVLDRLGCRSERPPAARCLKEGRCRKDPGTRKSLLLFMLRFVSSESVALARVSQGQRLPSSLENSSGLTDSRLDTVV